MCLLNMWREALGNVMRQELHDVMRRLGGANQSAIHGFYNNIWQTIDVLYRVRKITLTATPAK
jgi:hypothetical protein